MAAPAKIFVVDDDAGLSRLMERALKREGFSTHTAASGKEALNWLSESAADLMLLDLKLQDIEGKDLVKQLSASGKNIPFIIITGQGDERVAVEMMKQGALDYLVKDVQFLEIVVPVVRRVLENLETARRLEQAQAALEESRKEILNISERERRHFGAELHDGLGQQLTGIELQCQSLKLDLPADRPDLHEQLSKISSHLREAIAQARSLARGLSPVNLGSGGLTEALDELAIRMSRNRGVKCTFKAPATAPLIDDTVAAHLFRIAQEAVTNAVKHSGGTRITIGLSRNAGTLRLEVSDNGNGNKPAGGKGIGLRGMQHRASLIGGDFEITSVPGRGTSIKCSVKISKA